MKITRRQLAAALTAGAARAAVVETAEEPQKSPAGRIAQNVSTVAQVQVPMDVEPAFQFKAQ